MKQHRLIWHLFPAFLFVGLAVLVAVLTYASSSFKSFYYQQIENNLQERANMAQYEIAPLLKTGDFSGVDKICKELGEQGKNRITIIMPDGRVVGDTQENPATIKGHGDRPEFKDAISKGLGSDTRFSSTVNRNMKYVAIPIKDGDKILAVARISVSIAAIERELTKIRTSIIWGGTVIAACAIAISLLVSRRICNPIEQMRSMAHNYASGDFSGNIKVSGASEIADLAYSLNTMARQLSEKIDTIVEDKKQIQAILASMIEGVLAVNEDGRVIDINSAAAELLGVNTKQAQGRMLEEAVRNPDIQEFVKKIFDGHEPSEADIHITNNGQRYLQLHGTDLTDSKGRKNGVVVVLHDITRIRRLEEVRRDFVANVSHELKTPITSIKGFVETLQEGAINNPQEATRFLEIIGRHAERLNAIVDDLLSLSRLEEDVENRRLFFEDAYLKPVLASAVELAKIKAEKKNLAIELNCDDNISARINTVLIEQAVLNFIDNAVKYSNSDGKIIVTARQDDREIKISVSDSGSGIEERHLPRLFERFYVVDKSRSRKVGGTGLGLSIVKHIAQVHGGDVSVVSKVNQGSTFTLHLPVDIS